MKKKSILISAIAMLAVSAIVLSTASYAWFTGSVTPSITKVKVGVAERNLIQLSGTSLKGEGTDWRSVLDVSANMADGHYINKSDSYGFSTTELEALANPRLDSVSPLRTGTTVETDNKTILRTNAGLATAIDVPTGDPASTMALEFMSKRAGDVDTNSTFSVDEDFNVVKLRFLMRAEQDITMVYLKTHAAVLGDAVTAIDSSATIHTTNDDKQVKVDYSVRMAFLYSTEFASEAAYATATCEGLKVWAPYKEADDSGLRNGVASGYAEGSGYTYSSSTDTSTDNVALFPFAAAGGMREVICYIWIEGADEDCVEQVAGGLFSAVIAFTDQTNTAA